MPSKYFETQMQNHDVKHPIYATSSEQFLAYNDSAQPAPKKQISLAKSNIQLGVSSSEVKYPTQCPSPASMIQNSLNKYSEVTSS